MLFRSDSTLRRFYRATLWVSGLSASNRLEVQRIAKDYISNEISNKISNELTDWLAEETHANCYPLAVRILTTQEQLCKKEHLSMSTNRFVQHKQRRLFAFLIAGLLAVGIFYAPVALDTMAGTAFTPQAHACQSASGGC